MPYAKLRTNSKRVISVIHCTFSGLSVFVDPISFFTGYQYTLKFSYKTGVLCQNKPDFRVYFVLKMSDVSNVVSLVLEF